MIKDSFIYYHLFSIIDDRIFVFIITEEEYYKVKQKSSDFFFKTALKTFFIITVIKYSLLTSQTSLS